MSEDDKDSRGEKRKSGRYNKKKGKFEQKTSDGKGDNGSKPPCALCALFGGNPDSHGAATCNKRKLFSNALDNGQNGNKRARRNKERKNWNKEEVNTIILRRTKKAVKRAFKRNGLNYESSSDSSNSSKS